MSVSIASHRRARVAAALLAGLALAALPGSPARAASLVVNTTDDTVAAADGLCTPREAIANANANTDTTSGDCVGGSGADTITFSVSGTVTLGSTLPAITDPAGLTIDGTGQSITLSGNHTVRVLDVSSGAALSLLNLTVANGNAGLGDGGGLNAGGTVTLTNTTLSGNSARLGGGIFTIGGNILVANSTIRGNAASVQGGGIFVAGLVTLINTTVSGNSASGSFGGGIHNSTGIVALTNVTVSGNSAPSGGGGISNFNQLSLTNSTVAGNAATINGGGMFNGTTGSATYRNTIVASNTAGGDCGGPGAMASLGHNLASDGTCPFTGPSDQVNTDPLLGPLANNGGLTETHALLSGSPAVDAGDNTGCPATDQRGVARPQGGVCDIGAYEHVPAPQAFFTLTPCRVADTRNAAGPSGGPALAANTTRTFPAAGLCGIPSDAGAVAINVTVVAETDVGDLRLYAAGRAAPTASTINFTASRVRANNAIIPLGTGGQITVQCDMPPGSTGITHFLFDVTGYFR